MAIAGHIIAWYVCSGWRKIASDKENTSSFPFASSERGMKKSQNWQGSFEQGRSSVWGVALSGPPVGLVMGDDFCFTDGACLCYSGGLLTEERNTCTASASRDWIAFRTIVWSAVH